MAKTFLLRPRLRRLFERLDPALLSSSGDDTGLTAADVGLEARPESRSQLALGLYSRVGLEEALKTYGFLDRLAERGLTEVELRLDLEDPFHPRFIAWSVLQGCAVVDLTLSLSRGAQVGLSGDAAALPLLFVDGLQLQHPGRRFEWSRPPLPGQVRPGLKLFSEILEMLALLAWRLGAQGLALVPSSFHAAWIYERYFQFVDPVAQGRFDALRYALRLRPLWLLSWAMVLGCVRGPDGEVFSHVPSPMLCWLSPGVAHGVDVPGYAEVARLHASTRFELDLDQLRARFPWEVMPPEPPPESLRAILGEPPPRRGVDTPADAGSGSEGAALEVSATGSLRGSAESG